MHSPAPNNPGAASAPSPFTDYMNELKATSEDDIRAGDETLDAIFDGDETLVRITPSASVVAQHRRVARQRRRPWRTSTRAGPRPPRRPFPPPRECSVRPNDYIAVSRRALHRASHRARQISIRPFRTTPRPTSHSSPSFSCANRLAVCYNKFKTEQKVAEDLGWIVATDLGWNAATKPYADLSDSDDDIPTKPCSNIKKATKAMKPPTKRPAAEPPTKRPEPPTKRPAAEPPTKRSEPPTKRPAAEPPTKRSKAAPAQDMPKFQMPYLTPKSVQTCSIHSPDGDRKVSLKKIDTFMTNGCHIVAPPDVTND